MQLIADRFVSDDRGHTIDLASGERVELVWSTAGAPHEQRKWAERCDWLAALRHPLLARLIDYGPYGASRRFEAWRLGVRQADRAVHRSLMARANVFLSAVGRTTIGGGRVVVGVDRGRVVGVPDPSAGFPCDVPREDEPCIHATDLLGVARRADGRITALADLLGHVQVPRVVAVGIWSSASACGEDAAELFARAARLSGAVPISARLCGTASAAAIGDRTLLIICHADPASGWAALVQATLEAAHAHVVLFTGQRSVPCVHTVHLQSHSIDALVSSVRPGVLDPALRRRVASVARRSQGAPSRFEALLWQARELEAEPRKGKACHRSLSRAAEHGTPYGAQASIGAPASMPDPPDVGTAGGSLDAGSPGSVEAPTALRPSVICVVDQALPRLRRDLVRAQDQLEHGCHARGARAARQAIAALARRGDWTHAAGGAIALATVLLRRGEASGAEAVLRDARRWATESQEPRTLNTVGLLTGKLLTDTGRLAEAQRTLEVIELASRSGGYPEWVPASRALARCQFWQGQFDDAWRTMEPGVTGERRGVPLTDSERILASALRARVAIGRAQLGDAIAEAARARDEALRHGGADVNAAAGYSCALAQLAVGDLKQADAAAVDALAAARRSHRQTLGVCLRILRAEIARRRGAGRAAAVLIQRFSRVPAARVPAIFRVRVDLLRELLAGGSPSDVASRKADATGFKALALLVPQDARRHSAPGDAVAELLQCCQTSDEDAAVLANVCGRLRGRLRATSVAFFIADQEQFVSVASSGGRTDAAAAARVHAARQLVLPHAGGERPEAGVPVRYAGEAIGVLVAQWNPASPWQADEIALLLSTGAVACGPALSGVIARRKIAAVARKSDLIGVSAGISQVRTAIDRAAGAPFPVLIEGESGSGKELVARSLHRQSPRRERTFCALNCAALPDDLVESELFGHARGAFTGAMAERRGVFEEAHGGTLFLDEIGELSLRAQSKLLRTVQDGEVRRLGENLHRRVDVRLVAATNRDLKLEAAAGRFRSDLLYRLDVIRIALPPLRQRVEDIELLADHFWRDCCARISSRATLSGATLAVLARYHWPGNIRELQNVLASVAVRAPRRGVVPPTALPPHFTGQAADGLRLDDARRDFESRFVRTALARSGGNRTRAADELGLSRQGLAKLMGRLGISDS